MIRLLLAFLSLSHFVQGVFTDPTAPDCPPLDGSSRSIWSILGSCALTLVICLWHAVHLNVPKPGEKLIEILGTHAKFIVLSFVAPEWMIGNAAGQWVRVQKSVIEIRERGYKWSETHSYFSEFGGFIYRERRGYLEVIRALRFVQLCEQGKIMNPLVREDEIKDRSKSDAVSKAIFTVQLLWFVLQVIVRYFTGIAVTLVELDTVCMAVLAVFYLLLWWDKPLRAKCPHVFHETEDEKLKVFSLEELSNAWKPQPGIFHEIMSHCSCKRKPESDSPNDEEKTFLLVEKHGYSSRLEASIVTMIKNIHHRDASTFMMCVTWCLLGALHLAAWNYEFLTETEVIIWRGVSLGLTGGPLVGVIAVFMRHSDSRATHLIGKGIWNFALYSAIFFRVVLVILMLLSLRALPCSAHEVVTWTEYIPHL